MNDDTFPLLFLKAVVKKQVWIPGYTKRDGTVVAGAYKMVNVSADHDEHKVVSGQGNYTQQQAHKKLAKKKWFGELPHDHKVAHVLHEATKIQDEAGENARLSTLQKNLLAGKSPIPAEWKAFHNASDVKRNKVIAAMHAAGKGAALLEGYTAWQNGNAAAPAQPAPKAEEKKPKPESKPEPPKEEPKPEPKVAPAPVADDAHPTEKIAAVQAKIEAAKAKLPDGHHLKAGQIKKLDAIAQALAHGDEKSILMHAYHTHTYGKQAAKLANEALAALGSKHTVTVGQKMAEHPALKGDPAKEPEKQPEPEAKQEPAPAPAAEMQPESPKAPEPEAKDALAMPDFSSGKNDNPKVVEYYEKVAQKIIDHAKAGNVAVLEDMKAAGLKPNSSGKVGNTFKGKTANSKALLALYDAALAHAKGETPAKASEPAKPSEIVPEGASHAIEKPDTAGLTDLQKEAIGNVQSLFEKGSAPGHIGGQVSNLKEYVDAFNTDEPGDQEVVKYAKAALESLGSPWQPKAAAAPEPAPEKEPTGGLFDDINAAAEKGDMQSLKDIADYAAKNGMQKTAEHAAKKIAELAQKNADSWAQPAHKPAPVEPEGSTFKGAVSAITQALKKKDANDEVLQNWAKFDAKGDEKFQVVVDYAKQVLASIGGTVNEGPKEGDTKQGADGMLVFKDGRWHKQGGEEKPTGPSAAAAVAKLKLGKMTGKNSGKLKKKAEQLKQIAINGGAAELDKAVQITPSGAVKVMGFSVALSEGSTQYGPSIPEFVKYVKALHEAVVGAGAVGGEKAAPTSYAIPPKPQKVVGAAAPAATESIDGWKQVGPQGGYNPGGTFEDADGQQWYVKFPAGGDKIAKNELLATKLYALAGVKVPEVKLINQGGKIGLASKIMEGAVADKSKLLEGKAPGLLQGFGADAWLANWDTVGNNPAAGKGFDNILFTPDGEAIRIDAGGALLYGGAGGKKQKFENEVTDLQTMLDPSKNKNTAAVFGKMSAADIAASVAKVGAIPDHEIEGLVMEFGPGSDAEKTRLAEKLIARKYDMMKQYPSNAQKKADAIAAKAKPNPSALPVDADVLPKPNDYMNWGGTGKPISEKPYVKGNIADEQEILNLALQGNLTALKAYKFQPVDKMTGAPVGEKKSIEEHPSKYVQGFYDTIVSYLDMLANPPEPLRIHTPKKASTLASLSAAFKPHDFGMTTEKAEKNAQVGFWIALGVADEPGKFAKAAKKLSTAAITKAKAAHAALPASVRKFISGVQGSGSYNNPYRDGKETDHSGAKTREVLTDLYNHASLQEAGTTIHKWMSIAPETIKQFMDAPEGLVFQNPGSMCTSYDPTATKHFGKDRVTIRYADGAKALNSFASGSFASEMEITTLPGARFMVLSRKMVADEEHGKPNDKRFELELLMLPPDPTYVDNLLKKA